MRLLQESRKIVFFGFGVFVFLVFVFRLFGSPSRSRGNNYAFYVVFLVLQNYLFRYYVRRTASLLFQLVFSASLGCTQV